MGLATWYLSSYWFDAAFAKPKEKTVVIIWVMIE